MEVRCEGCAGCCLDWRPLLETVTDGTRAADPSGDGDDDGHRPARRRESLDGVANLVPLERDEVRAFVDAGLADALTPRLWAADDDDPAVEIDGYRVAAIAGRPAFFVGLAKPPKPVAPFDREEATWLPTCTFLDPTTLQCRIHDDDLYPAECGDYPAHNLALEQETECERVERVFGGERLLSATIDGDGDETALEGFMLGPQAVGGKVFCHPRPDELEGVVERVANGETDREDRAAFVAVAAASSPGTLATSEPHHDRALERALAADSWAGRAIAAWNELFDGDRAPPEPAIAERIEDDRGAPETPGWEAVTDDG